MPSAPSEPRYPNEPGASTPRSSANPRGNRSLSRPLKENGRSGSAIVSPNTPKRSEYDVNRGYPAPNGSLPCRSRSDPIVETGETVETGGSAEEEEANWAELRCDAQAGA